MPSRLGRSSWINHSAFTLEGQVSGFHDARSGHAYFDLVEPSDVPGRAVAAKLSVALFKGARPSVDQTLASAGGLALGNDLQLRIRARLDFYPPSGRLQLIMNGVDPTAIPMGGTGFQDFSRIAASDPVVWRDILQTNRTVVLEQINAFEAALADLKNSLIQGDAEALTSLITQASVRRKAWKLSSGRVPSNEDDAA